VSAFAWGPPALDRRAQKYLQLEPATLGPARPVWQEALELLRPAAWWTAMGFREFLQAFAPLAEDSQALARNLAGAQGVLLLAATIGPELGERARQCLAQRETFRGYILDRAGSYLAEHQVAGLDAHLEADLARRGLRGGRRYSPGYQDFPLAAQEVFLRLINGALPRLHLAPGGLLLPEKSITAVKGVWA